MAEQNVITSMLDDLFKEQPIQTALCIGQNLEQYDNNQSIQWHYFSVTEFLNLPFTQRYDVGFVLLDLPCVVEGHCLPAVGKVFLQFKLKQQALVAAGFVDGVGPHLVGAAQGHAFGAGQVAAGPLAAEVGLDLPGGGQGLQAV